MCLYIRETLLIASYDISYFKVVVYLTRVWRSMFRGVGSEFEDVKPKKNKKNAQGSRISQVSFHLSHSIVWSVIRGAEELWSRTWTIQHILDHSSKVCIFPLSSMIRKYEIECYRSENQAFWMHFTAHHRCKKKLLLVSSCVSKVTPNKNIDTSSGL